MLAFMWAFMKLWKTHANAKITYRKWWLAKNSKWANSVGWQPGKTTKSWVHQKECGQQAGGGDYAPLLYSGETPPGMLSPALVPLIKEGHGTAGESPEESHAIWQEGWRTSQQRQAGKVGQCLKGAIKKPKRGNLCQILQRNSLLWGWWDSGTGCPGKFQMPQSWKCSRSVNKALSKLV